MSRGRDETPLEFSVDQFRREGLIEPPDTQATQTGTGRVELRFSPSGHVGARARGRHRVRRGELERPRDRLHLRRATAPARSARCRSPTGRCRSRGSTPAPSPPTSSGTAGAWPASAAATSDLQVDVPPLMTRPKAATVGVGRQVILRPAVQKRYVELDEPSLSDQRPDLVRLAGGHRRPRARARPARAASAADGAAAGRLQGHRGRRRRGPRRGRARRHVRAALRDRLRPRHHDRGGHAARPARRRPDVRALDAQQAAAVRRRRHHPDQRHDDGPRGARPAAAGRGTVDAGGAGRTGLRGGGRRPDAGLRGGAGRQRDDDGARARHRPGAAGCRAVRHVDRDPAERDGLRPRARLCTPAPGPCSSRRSVRTSAATSSPACSPPAWTGTSACGCSSTSARTARSCSATATGSCRPPRPRDRPSRAVPSGAGCAPPRGRSRASGWTTT